MLKNPWKIPTAGSGGRWLPQLKAIFSVHRHISGEIFKEDLISYFYVKLLTDRYTDRQTNAGCYITSDA